MDVTEFIIRYVIAGCTAWIGLLIVTILMLWTVFGITNMLDAIDGMRQIAGVKQKEKTGRFYNIMLHVGMIVFWPIDVFRVSVKIAMLADKYQKQQK